LKLHPSSAAAALALTGCSLVYPLDDYDRGGTGGGSSASASGSSVQSGATSTAPSTGSGGEGGAPPCGAGIYPPATTLVDTFDDAASQQFFGCAQQTGGELRVDLPASGDLYCISESELPYCMAASSITFQVVEAATASIPGMQTWIIFRAADDSGNLSLLIEGNGFRLLGDASGTPFEIDIPNGTYDPFTNVWFRVAGEAGDAILSTSPDALTWTERGRGPCPLDLDGVFVAFGANRYFNAMFPESANLPAETARFDCLNTPCP